MAQSDLGIDDLKKLQANPTPEVKAEIASKLGDIFAGDAVSDEERQLAKHIVEALFRDTADMVRASLSRSLSQLPNAPVAIVEALARDIDEVAMPVLQDSPVLDEALLLEIVRKGSAAKQGAIAGRETVSPAVSTALVETDNRDVVARLVENEGAEIPESSLTRVAERFGDDELIAGPMVRRKDLPVVAVERLVTAVSDKLRDYLIEHHNISADVAAQLIQESRERATVDLVDGVDSEDVPELVRQLAANGRLTPSLLLRAICMGEMRFVEKAVAHLAEVPEAKAWRLMHDKGPLGLKAIYARARLPQVYYSAFRVAIDTYQEMAYDGRDGDLHRFRRQMLERVLTKYEGMEAEDLDFLLSNIAKLSNTINGQAVRRAAS